MKVDDGIWEKNPKDDSYDSRLISRRKKPSLFLSVTTKDGKDWFTLKQNVLCKKTNDQKMIMKLNTGYKVDYTEKFYT